jgi:hypothetical protein
MDKFLERHKIAKLIQEEIDNLVTIKDIEIVVKHLLKKKAPGPDSFTDFCIYIKGFKTSRERNTSQFIL